MKPKNETETAPLDSDGFGGDGGGMSEGIGHALPRASSIFDYEQCPLCGGASGFSYILTIRGIQSQPWKNGDAYESFFESCQSSAKHGAYRCQDCGKIIKSNAE